MDEFDRTHRAFTALIRSAGKGDARSLLKAKRAALELQRLAEAEALDLYNRLNRTCPRILRRSYGYEFFIENKFEKNKGVLN